ncbi:pilus assembly protein TadG-related protein [Nocardioides alcanivorans]|uniref:pilus assembly protein TadG-related protein n=1 Tax=Nocardioides alcanivorans TaxID=2897352 RepID=UPI001F3235F8|nr:hypothetical protein [Nocardioides alcanivorans]
MVIAKPRDERGAVAPLVAVFVVILVGLASFAVDLGYQRVAARDMQAVADIVAMDMARQLDGKTTAQLGGTAGWQSALSSSLARNQDRAVGDSLAVTTCAATQTSVSSSQVCATPGIYRKGQSPEFVDSGSAPATHVRVITRTKVDYFFPVYANDGWVTKTAYAQAEAGACFSVGTYAARIRLGDGQILGPLLKALGTDVGLSLLDAQGLAAADIKLIDLVDTNLGVGGYDELVDADVSLGSFYLAMAQVLEREGGQAAQVAVLRRLATVAARDVVVKISDIVGIDTTNSAGLDAVVNLFDLVSTAAFVANGENSIAIPDLNVNVLGVSKLKASLKIGQKPIAHCGRPRSVRGESSQVELLLSGNLANLNLGVASISAPIAISLKLAPAVVDLDAVVCLSPKKRLEFMVTSGLVDLEITIGNPANKRDLAVKLLLGLITVVDGYLRLYTSPSSGQTETGSVTVDMDDYEAALPAEFGSNSIGVPHLNQDLNLNVLGILPVGGLLGVVVNPLLSLVVNPLVAALDSLLLSPLLQALGINIAGADVYARPTAGCGLPRLTG